VSWARSYLCALLFVIAGYAAAMGVDGLMGTKPALINFVAAGLLGVIAEVGLAVDIHDRTRPKEDR
jgi:hypothetical protein